ncbi:MAG: ankyrin repeat domain-containing protein, partial [Nitrosopumilus sp.]|nr:ankyrin repeat domain-containing protein [Nitrosopumilus sp.]
CDPNVKSYIGQSLLHNACKGGNVSLVETLIHKHKADVNARDDQNSTPLHVAAYSGKAEVVSCLIDDFGCDPNVKGYIGKSLLHDACRGGNVSLVETLIRKHKADVNARDDENKTPLHHAAYNGKAEVVSCLIDDFGCDPNVKGYIGKSLLHEACKGGNVSLVETLIHKHKADVNARNDQNSTPLHVAAYSGKAEVVSCLIDEFGCDPCQRDGDGDSLLHLACLGGHAGLVLTLLNSEFCNLFLTNNEGNTPLHICAIKGNVECVNALLAANAPVLIRNKNGKTPTDVASYKTRLILERYMKDHRENISINYNSLLDTAKKNYSGEHRIVRLFVIGNPGAGKSSLVESLQREGFFKSIQRVSETSVPPHTAGIIPIEFYSRQCGRVLLYDFAGDIEYYSSHAAILGNIALTGRGDNIFLVAVNLMESKDVLAKQFHYWLPFILQQKFARETLSLGILGTHYDLASKIIVREKVIALEKVLMESKNDFTILGRGYFLIDSCSPRSSGIINLKNEILMQTKHSLRYQLSDGASLLLGLLKMDFGEVTACSIATILSHVSDCGINLPHDLKNLQHVILELHELGIFLLLGDCSREDSFVVMNSSNLTNEVHKLLFSKDARTRMCSSRTNSSLNIGVIPGSVLDDVLPPYITKECLLGLQYCQEIKPAHIRAFPSLEHSTSTNQSFFFFPALCSLDKCNTPWGTDPDFSYGVGWLAQCTDTCDYFPPRFLHVLLLRLVFRFALSVPSESQAPAASADHASFKLHCTMWKTGVQWSMEEGVKCRVEMVNDNKGIVVLIQSIENNTDNSTTIFSDIIHQVMEAKAEFCHRIKPEFFLLDSTGESDYLNLDNTFAMSDVNRVLKCPEGKKMIFSVSRKGRMSVSKLSCMHRLTLWDLLFPIKLESVLVHFKDVYIANLFLFGLRLGIPQAVVETIEADFPSDANRRMIAVLKAWMNSLGFPCWGQLVEALEDAGQATLADKITDAHGNSSVHIKYE